MDRKRARYREELAVVAENLSNFDDLRLWMGG